MAQQIARRMRRRRRAAAETINQRPPAPRVPPFFSLSLSHDLSFREAHANRTHVNGEPILEKKERRPPCNFPRAISRARVSNTRITSAKAAAARTDVLNCVQTNHFGIIDVSKYSCVMFFDVE